MQSFPNRCQHIKVNGTQCGCPALRRSKLCYFHKRHHEERVQLNSDRARRRPATIDLPVLEDANSIQVSLMQIMRLLVSGRIDHRTAGLTLYALQTASHNLGRTTFEPDMRNVVLDQRAIGETPLGAHVWEESDFESEEDDEVDEAAEREAALEEARRQAKKKADLMRWAEGEAVRLAKVGAQEREAVRQAEAAYQAARAANDREAEQRSAAARNARPASAITTAASAIVPAPKPAPRAPSTPPPQSKSPQPAPSLPKRPPDPMIETRQKVREEIWKEIPAMLAVLQSAKKNAGSSG